MRPEGKDARQRAAGGETSTGAAADAAAAPHALTAQAGPLQPHATHLQQQAPGHPGVNSFVPTDGVPPPGPVAIVDVLVRLLMVPFNMLQVGVQSCNADQKQVLWQQLDGHEHPQVQVRASWTACTQHLIRHTQVAGTMSAFRHLRISCSLAPGSASASP
eukprot:269300-Pelagomonas_calceolata.AAC.6